MIDAVYAIALLATFGLFVFLAPRPFKWLLALDVAFLVGVAVLGEVWTSCGSGELCSIDAVSGYCCEAVIAIGFAAYGALLIGGLGIIWGGISVWRNKRGW